MTIFNDQYAGYDGKGAIIVAASNISELRNKTEILLNSTANVLNNGILNVWAWDELSTLGDNGTTVIKPNTIDVGRWILLAPIPGQEPTNAEIDSGSGTVVKYWSIDKLKRLILSLITSVINAAITFHVGQIDPHTQYSKKTDVTSVINAGITSHVEQIDPHTQYSKKTDVTQLLLLSERKPAGTNAGSVTAGTSPARSLNTVDYNSIPGAALDAVTYRFTLPIGKWRIRARAPSYSDGHKLILFSITDNAIALTGANADAGNAAFVQTDATLREVLINTTVKVYELRHYHASPPTGAWGSGIGLSYGVEIYSQLEIERIV